MKELLQNLKKDYLNNAAKNAHEVFDYFQVGAAYDAGVNAVSSACDEVFSKFLEKAGPFIQGLDSEEIYEMFNNSKNEIF